MSRFLGVDKLEIELVLEAEDCDVEDFCVKSLLALALRLTLLLVLKYITYIIRPKKGDLNRDGGTGGAIAPPIFLEIGEIVSYSTNNISRSKEGTTPESH